MIAADLAPLFAVSPKRLNESIRRHETRFPPDFGFRLSRRELSNLRPQFTASSSGHGGHRHPPFVVTEYGVVMLANVVDSERAIATSVRVVREFVRLRTIARSRDSIRGKLRELARAVRSHEVRIDELFAAMERSSRTSPMANQTRELDLSRDPTNATLCGARYQNIPH